MYMMTMIDLGKFPSVTSCREWTEKLIEEQSVLLFPGSPCFNFAGCFRIVLTVPEDMIIEACGRIKEFCEKYYQN
jgi:tyrosine aminotransferase